MEGLHDPDQRVLHPTQVEIGEGLFERRAVVVDVREGGGELGGHPLGLLEVGQGPGHDQAEDEHASGQHAGEQRADADELERERRDDELGRDDAEHDEAGLAGHPPPEERARQHPASRPSTAANPALVHVASQTPATGASLLRSIAVKIVVARGEPRQRGRGDRPGLAGEIHRSLAFYRRYFERRGFDRARLEETLRPFVAAAEEILPQEVEAIRGTAEGAGVPFLDLFAPNAFEELDPLMPTPSMRRPRAGSNGAPRSVWSGPASPARARRAVAGRRRRVRRRRGRDPERARRDLDRLATVATWRPAVGMNSAGGAQAVMSHRLRRRGRRAAVLVSRHALETTGREDALRRTSLTPRSGGYARTATRSAGVTPSRSRPPDAGHDPTRRRAPTTTSIGARADGDPASPERGPARAAARIARGRTPGRPRRHGRPRGPRRRIARICLHADAEDSEESDAILFSMVRPRARRCG